MPNREQTGADPSTRGDTGVSNVALGDGDVEPPVGAYEQPCAVGELEDELAGVGLQDFFQHQAFRQGSDPSRQVVRAALRFFSS
jgi:hypothetical protein